jgi:hypothetical protein
VTFAGTIFITHENNILLIGMEERRSLGSMEKGGFGTSVSFDIDEVEAPKRRQSPRKKEEEDVHSSDSSCPGCGHEINQQEWLDALVGFVSGAHDFAIGNPVRARIVATLRNEVARMQLPNPHDAWELEVVGRLLKEIERIVVAEVRRNQMDTEEQKWVSVKEQAFAEAEVALRPVLEAEIRNQVETELWAQFEQAWKERQSKESE